MSFDEMTTIESYIPHRAPMRLIDRLIEADDQQALVEADVPMQGRFVRDGAMPTWVGIEHMAETIAAWAGARARRRGQPVPLGLLLGTRKLEIGRATVPAGATLRIQARCELLAANGLGMFECRMMLGDEEVASAFISVFEPEDAMSLLAGKRS
jgi:predicted hotdog family 3-hydroxylacyl-ACP dehydratase